LAGTRAATADRRSARLSFTASLRDRSRQQLRGVAQGQVLSVIVS
jgi:hypothetical protein